MNARTRGLRPLLTMATAALGVVTLAACSAGGETTGSTGPTTPGAPAEPVTIEYIHRLPDGDGMTKVADLAAEWNKANPDIQVTTTKFDGVAKEMLTKLETDVKAGNAACLAQVDYAETPTAYVKGLLQDVTADAEQYKKDFSGAFSLMQVDGKTVGLPQDTGPLVYFYNKTAFAELGLDVPTNLTEFVATAAKAADAEKYVAAFEPDEAKFWLSGQAAAAGATWYAASGDAWKVTADSDASAIVADFWQTLLDGDDALVLERWSDAFTAALTDGRLIGTIGAAWETPLLADAMAGTDNDGQWAVAQLPDFGGGVTGPDGGSGVAVTASCEHPAEALKFAGWFNTQIDALVSQGLVTAAIGEMKTPDTIASFYGGQDVFAELAKANANLSSTFTYMPFFGTVGDAMSQAAAGAGSGSGKVADVFTAAQDQSVKSLKDAGLPVAE